jgi:hypothetical protein
VASVLGGDPAPSLIPQTVATYPSFLSAQLPASLHELGELQNRLRRALDVRNVPLRLFDADE